MLKLLRDKYREAYGVTVIPVIKAETCSQSYFCIKDKEDTIVCSSRNDGVSIYDNTSNHYTITIVDFEHFINQFKNSTQAGKGKKCDFILYDQGDAYIILNELSALNTAYLEDHKVDGNMREGKRSYAIKQIQESIDKLIASQDICNYINKKNFKIGLFSYKITEDENMPHEIQQSISKFSMVKYMYSDITVTDIFSNGFVFEQRIYPMPFELK